MFRIFDVDLQPSWSMEMDVKGKMNIRDLGRRAFFPPLLKNPQTFPQNGISEYADQEKMTSEKT